MKKFFVLSLVTILLAMASCQKDQDTLPTPSSTEDVATTPMMKSGTLIESSVNPSFGKPASTNYYFKVYDPSGTLALSVKLYQKATGIITYLPMQKIGSYWTLSTKISANGWYDYRYVYSANKANISSTNYTLCNSKNTFSLSGISSLTWPFGADGSSWYNRNVYVNGSYQKWLAGTEGGSGYGWNQGTHVGTSERYSDDWNRGTGSQDLGAVIRSPLDGYIAAFGTYSTSLGASKYVAVVQKASDGNFYRFYVGHLQNYPSSLYVGKYVRAGIDQIGNLGSSGASSPHAHTSLRNVTNGANTSVKFYFNAY